jgi:hypothetical protein
MFIDFIAGLHDLAVCSKQESQEEGLKVEDEETSIEEGEEATEGSTGLSLKTLEKLTVRELREYCKTQGIKGYSKAVKEGKAALANYIYSYG